MKRKSFTLVLFTFFVGLTMAQNRQNANQVLIRDGDSEAAIIRKAAQVRPSARQLRWQQLELTAFFHFGVNTFTNKEWGDGTEDPKIFNPKKLDANQWVLTMKNAGFKQVILTAKHHDGFCLWPTKFTAHSLVNSPWKNGKGDVVKEVAAACKRYKMGFGIYLSPWDRNYKDYGDTEKYNTFFVNQLTELLSNYGKIDEVWFDGANGTGPNGKKPVYHFDKWYQLIRKLQPSATIAVMGPDVRWVGTESGYGRLTEWSVLPADQNMISAIEANSQKEVVFAPMGDKMGEDLGSREKLKNAKGLVWYPAETDVSIREGWFYHPEQDKEVKTPKSLIDIYFASVGRNSVLLLNVPPNTDGLISESDVATLKGWAFLRNELFAQNLAKTGLFINTQGKKLMMLTDNKLSSFYLHPKVDSCIINLNLKEVAEFDVISLQENIAIGQRVEKFVVEYLKGTSWVKITEGTTIGYKRLLKFNAVKAKNLRLRILSSRLNPAIAEIGIYKSKD